MSSIPDYRRDTGADAPRRVLPRVAVALLGLALAATGVLAGQPTAALYSAQVTGFFLLFIGARGFWLPNTRVLQLIAAVWVVISCAAFGVHGAALAATLVIAAALAAVTLSE